MNKYIESALLTAIQGAAANDDVPAVLEIASLMTVPQQTEEEDDSCADFARSIVEASHENVTILEELGIRTKSWPKKDKYTDKITSNHTVHDRAFWLALCNRHFLVNKAALIPGITYSTEVLINRIGTCVNLTEADLENKRWRAELGQSFSTMRANGLLYKGKGKEWSKKYKLL